MPQQAVKMRAPRFASTHMLPCIFTYDAELRFPEVQEVPYTKKQGPDSGGFVVF